MDPNVTLLNLLTSIKMCDTCDAETAMLDLIEWMSFEGFKPAALEECIATAEQAVVESKARNG